jgi:hypothetical protein
MHNVCNVEIHASIMEEGHGCADGLLLELVIASPVFWEAAFLALRDCDKNAIFTFVAPSSQPHTSTYYHH